MLDARNYIITAFPINTLTGYLFSSNYNLPISVFVVMALCNVVVLFIGILAMQDVQCESNLVDLCKKNINQLYTNSNKQSMIGVLCSAFDSSTSCTTTAAWETDTTTGCYLKTKFPCVDFEADSENEGKDLIKFMSAVVVDSVAYFYEQATEKTGIFLVQDFSSKHEQGTDVTADIRAIIPQHSPATGSALEPTLQCYGPDSDSAVTDSTASNWVVGEYYCTYQATCEDLNRECSTSLSLRTVTTTVAEGVTDAADVDLNVEFVFLKNGDSTTLECLASNSYLWYDNNVVLDDETEQTYTYTHSTEDTILQCISRSDTMVSGNSVWNIFTVEAYDNSADVTEELQDVTDGEESTFTCTANMGSTFPSPLLAAWYWASADAPDTDTLLSDSIACPTTEDLEVEVSYTKEISYSDEGSFKCYLYNGAGDLLDADSLAAHYTTQYVVKTQISGLVPTPVNWFEYIATVPEVYYVKRDTLNLTCDISKETTHSVWWKLGDEYFFYDTSTLELKQLDPDSSEVLITNALMTPTEAWSLEEVELEDTAGHHTHQVLSIADYQSDITEPLSFNATCFLIQQSDIDTVAELTTAAETMEDEETEKTEEEKLLFKTLLVRFFALVDRPEVRGPLNEIQTEKTDIQLRCLTNGVPPAFIFFMFESKEDDSEDDSEETSAAVNITEELLAEEPAIQYNRYTVTRVSDELTTLDIQLLSEEYDQGVFRCYAINRDTGDTDPEPGPEADVIIEEKCAKGARFCFNGGVGVLGSSSLVLGLVLLFL